MKVFSHITILLFVSIILFLNGCTEATTEPLKLDTPTNLVFDNILTWDEVDNALEYQLYLNNELITLDENFYIINEEGSFEAYLIAIATGYEDSDASTTIYFTIEYDNEVEFTLNIDSEYITWNSVEYATEYNVFINGIQYTAETNQLNILDVPAGLLDISVQAVFPTGISSFSDTHHYQHNLIVTESIPIQYSIYSNCDVIMLSIVWCPLLWGRGATSFTITSPFESTKNSTASRPSILSSSIISLAKLTAFSDCSRVIDDGQINLSTRLALGSKSISTTG